MQYDESELRGNNTPEIYYVLCVRTLDTTFKYILKYENIIREDIFSFNFTWETNAIYFEVSVPLFIEIYIWNEIERNWTWRACKRM